ncbi:MAG: hypothetical protein RR705_05700 [Lachnospiraceae bacterium]
MGTTSGTWKKTIGCLCAVCVLGMLLFPAFTVQAEERSYDITFRSGSHGTVDNTTSVTRFIPYGTTLFIGDYDNMIHQENGYFFTGWSPQIESTVTGKAVYVAQYRKLIHEVDCRISYVDSDGMALATQQVKIVEKGAPLIVHPISIAGYEANEAEKSIVVEKKGTEIVFTYTMTGGAVTPPSTSEVTPGTVVQNETVSSNTRGMDNNIETQVPGNVSQEEQDKQLTNVPDNQIPRAGKEKEKSTQTIKDEAVPQGLERLDSKGEWVPITVGIISLLALAAVVILLIKRRKHT